MDDKNYRADFIKGSIQTFSPSFNDKMSMSDEEALDVLNKFFDLFHLDLNLGDEFFELLQDSMKEEPSSQSEKINVKLWLQFWFTSFIGR